MFLDSLFINSIVLTAQTLLMGQLEVIKAKNSTEFYEKLLKTGWSFFTLLGESKNKVLKKICSVFTVPIQSAAEADNIEL